MNYCLLAMVEGFLTCGACLETGGTTGFFNVVF